MAIEDGVAVEGGVVVELELRGGGRARILESIKDRVILLTDIASPPGRPLAGRCEQLPELFELKVRGCRKTTEDPDLPFRVEGRWVNLSRRQIGFLAKELGSAS